MVFYKECDAEQYAALKMKAKKDDDELKEYISGLKHRELNFIILNLGNMLQVCAIYFEVKQDNINDYLKLVKDALKEARMKTIVKELNQSINLRFEFPEETEIVEGIFIYEGESYVFINKMLFVDTLKYHDQYPGL